MRPITFGKLSRFTIVTYVVTDSDSSDQNRLDGVWKVSCGTDMVGLETCFIAVSCRLSPDCVQILPNANRLAESVPEQSRNKYEIRQ